MSPSAVLRSPAGRRTSTSTLSGLPSSVPLFEDPAQALFDAAAGDDTRALQSLLDNDDEDEYDDVKDGLHTDYVPGGDGDSPPPPQGGSAEAAAALQPTYARNYAGFTRDMRDRQAALRAGTLPAPGAEEPLSTQSVLLMPANDDDDDVDDGLHTDFPPSPRASPLRNGDGGDGYESDDNDGLHTDHPPSPSVSPTARGPPPAATEEEPPSRPPIWQIEWGRYRR